MAEEEIQAATAMTTAEYDKLKRKADLWDQYAIYDNDKEEEILVKDLITAYEKLEDIREFVLSRRSDIENDLEDFGMLKPVLNYFLEELRNDYVRM